MTTRTGLVCLAAAVTAAAGCSKGPPELTILTGRVMIDGKPVTAGTVSVTSEDDVTRTSALIRPDGTYRIIGAPVGPVRFSVSTEEHRVTLPEPGSGSTTAKPNPMYVETPKKYEKFETAGLATTVRPRGVAEFDVTLESK